MSTFTETDAFFSATIAVLASFSALFLVNINPITPNEAKMITIVIIVFLILIIYWLVF